MVVGRLLRRAHHIALAEIMAGLTMPEFVYIFVIVAPVMFGSGFVVGALWAYCDGLSGHG